MKKSKEQLAKEGCYNSEPGYYFSLCPDPYKNHMMWWSCKYNVKRLEEMVKNWGDKKVYAWRQNQTDWRSVQDFVIYDRYGSRLTWTEEPERILEVKLTDIGQEHWYAYTHYEVLNEYCYQTKIYEFFGGAKKEQELAEEIQKINRLCPVKK
jgi:hypothetical protein